MMFVKATRAQTYIGALHDFLGAAHLAGEGRIAREAKGALLQACDPALRWPVAWIPLLDACDSLGGDDRGAAHRHALAYALELLANRSTPARGYPSTPSLAPALDMRALALREGLVAHADRSEYTVVLGQLLLRVGHRRREAGVSMVEVLAVYRRAAALLESLAESTAPSCCVPLIGPVDARSPLAACLERLAAIMSPQAPAAAIRHYERAVELRCALPPDAPQAALQLVIAGRALLEIGALEQQLEAPMAFERVQQALELRRRACRAEPGDGRFHDALATAQLRAARLYAAAGETAEEARLLSGAVEAAQRAVQLAPRRPRLRYNLACALARWGQPRRALEALRRAVELGYRNVGVVTDDDLRPLRGDPRFDRLARRALPLNAEGWSVCATQAEELPC